jgi:hypothetical protein
VSTSAATVHSNGNLPWGNIPGWDNQNHAGFADEGLSTSDGSLRGFFTQWSWGTDGTVPEIFTGSAVKSRRMLRDALQRRVDTGPLSEKLMVPLAERVLYKNAEKLYGFSVDG